MIDTIKSKAVRLCNWFSNAPDRFLAWLERKNFISVHALTLMVTIWMTWHAFIWASNFALTTTRDGNEIAIIITAVLLPITALQAFSFSLYSNRPKL